MTTKQRILEAMHSLPEEAGFEEAMERWVLLYKIQRGIDQADAGQTVSHEEARKKLARWLRHASS